MGLRHWASFCVTPHAAFHHMRCTRSQKEQQLHYWGLFVSQYARGKYVAVLGVLYSEMCIFACSISSISLKSTTFHKNTQIFQIV